MREKVKWGCTEREVKTVQSFKNGVGSDHWWPVSHGSTDCGEKGREEKGRDNTDPMYVTVEGSVS